MTIVMPKPGYRSARTDLASRIRRRSRKTSEFYEIKVTAWTAEHRMRLDLA